MTTSGLHLTSRNRLRAERIRGVPSAGRHDGAVHQVWPTNGTAAVAPDAVDLAELSADVAGRFGSRAHTVRQSDNPRQPLADVIALPVVLPQLVHDPVTRTIDDSNRVAVRLGGRNLDAVLGWMPGALTFHTDGLWTVLQPDTAGGPLRRHDGRCSLTTDGRLRLSAAALTAIGVTAGADVAVLALPDRNAVALCRPAALLVGAPLSLLDEPTCTCCERNNCNG